jgi:serine phosphatase RsbU (regulator of sigma subunit)
LDDARNLEELLATLLDGLLNLFQAADRAVALLTNSDISAPQTCVVRYRIPGVKESKVLPSDSLLAKMTERDFSAEISSGGLTMCGPLKGWGGKNVGGIQVDADCYGHPFTHEDQYWFAEALARAAYAVDAWALHEAQMREQERLAELETARRLEIGLLPDTPEIEGYQFYVQYSPAGYVGGDFFDFVALGDNRLAVVCGEVRGKGAPAAILKARLSSEINALLSSGLAPLEVISRANARWCERNPRCQFATMVLAILGASTHELTLVNAGHMPPLVRHSDGAVVEIGVGQSGLPLGVGRSHEYMESHSSLRAGDALILFSDGVTDAASTSGEEFGSVRLHSAIAAKPGEAAELGKAIMSRIRDHLGYASQSDDICLVCVSRQEAAGSTC